MTIDFRSIVGGIVALFLLPFTVSGQSAEPPQQPQPGQGAAPYRGLFLGNEGAPERGQRLQLNVSLYGGYDDNVLADTGGQLTPDPRFQRTTNYGGGNVTLQYTKNGRRNSVDMGAGTGYRYYPALGALTGYSHWGSIGFALRPSTRTDLRTTASVSYSPYFGFGGIQGLGADATGQAVEPVSDFLQTSRAVVSLAATTNLVHRLSRRMSFVADFSIQNTSFPSETGGAYRNLGGGGGVRYTLSRHATLRLGYHYRRGTFPNYGPDRPIEVHDIDAGVDYSRALSLSRRTTFGFSTGSSLYRAYLGGTSSAAFDPELYRMHYLVTGSAYLNRQLGRTWNARLDYRRGLQMIEGFTQPFMSDAVQGTLGGYLGRRVTVGFSGQYSNGDVGERSLTGRSYSTTAANFNVQVALSRTAALYADALYYRYQFDRSVTLPDGLNRGLDRRSIRGGLTLSLPLIRR
jgi:hypothetical protein